MNNRFLTLLLTTLSLPSLSGASNATSPIIGEFDGDDIGPIFKDRSYSYNIYFTPNYTGMYLVYIQFESDNFSLRKIYDSKTSISIKQGVSYQMNLNITTEMIGDGTNRIVLFSKMTSGIKEKGQVEVEIEIPTASPTIVTDVSMANNPIVTQPYIYYFEDGEAIPSPSTYRFRGISSDQRNSNANYLYVSEKSFDFYNAALNDELEARAELRLYNFFDDFSIGEIRYSNRKYRHFPMEIERKETYTGGKYYSLHLKEYYAYSKANLLAKPKEEATSMDFLSRLLYIPVGLGKANRVYNFELRIEDATSLGDCFVFPIYFSRSREYISSYTLTSDYYVSMEGGKYHG